MSQISGIVLVDKPTGITSHDVVDQVRKIFQTRDVGHTGTLDPLATGLMIITVGDANKLSNFLMDGEKGYRVLIRLGIETDTLDRTGQITKESSVEISKEKIIEEVLKLQGDLELRVPDYSAVKVQGKKLYELARSSEVVPDIKRHMKFKNIEILKVNLPEIEVQFRCSKGAYVRSWVQELGQNLGCGAHVSELRRIWNSPYAIDQSKNIKGLTKEEILQSSAYIPLEKVLLDWPRVSVFPDEIKTFFNGGLTPRIELEALNAEGAVASGPGHAFVVSGDKILGFLEVLGSQEAIGKKVRIKRVFASQRNA